MQLQVKRVVRVASDAQLLNRHYRRRLWMAARNMGISRRKWLDELADVIYNFDGEILYPNGTKWDISDIDIDEIMGNSRWMSAFLEKNNNGEPCRETPLIERLRIIDLFFQIKYPHIHRHFGR